MFGKVCTGLLYLLENISRISFFAQQVSIMNDILIGTALLVLASSTNAAITVYTNEALYLSDLASLGYASITESFENDTVWSDSRNSIVAPGRTSFVTSKGITWTSNYPQNEIATGVKWTPEI